MDVRQILARSTVDGLTLVLPEQLSRTEYVAVSKVITALGGTWARTRKCHLFGDDPAPALAAYLAGGAPPLPERTTEGFVATPDRVADTVCRYPYANVGALPAGAQVLEPSAGDGALLRGIWRANPDVDVAAVEPNTQRVTRLRKQVSGGAGILRLAHTTLEEYASDCRQSGRYFDAVVMNPPFAITRYPSIWIDHVRLAFDLLAPGARLITIAPSSLVFRDDLRHRQLRAFLDQCGGWDELPDDSFGGIRTVVAWALRRPDQADPMATLAHPTRPVQAHLGPGDYAQEQLFDVAAAAVPAGRGRRS